MTGFEVTPGVAPQGDAFAFPLSFAQERLWFLDRFQPGSSAYNIPLAMRLTGKLDEQALEEALNGVVARHEGLRTSFCEEGGDPFQVVHAELRVQLSVVDLTSVPTASREQEADRLILNEALEPFDLATATLLRASLFRLAQDDHIFLLTVHHIVADGWSTGIVFRELAELYRARVTVGAPALPELSLQYGDFAAWQREWLEGERLEEQIEYWRRQLDGAPTVLELPSDRPRPPVQSDRGAHLGTLISNSLLERLKTLSQEEGATLFMTLLAAFDTLLARYTGQDDIVVGTPIANRTRVELESIVGFFTNTLVLRTSTDGNPTFRELIALVRELTLDAHAHQDLPFEKLVAELNPDRALSHSPLFQVMFALQNTGRGQIELPGLTLSRMELERGTAKFDLGLFARELPTGLRLSFEYSTDLFDEDRIERLLGHFRKLLHGVVEEPDRRIGEIELLTLPERRQLQAWNATTGSHPFSELRVHEIVEAQARRSPDAVAACLGSANLTYEALNRRANQLAHYLRELGVGPGVPVAISVERSPEQMIAVLGTLKAGGAYVPLDPSYPAQRLAFMLDEAAASVVVTQAPLRDRLPEHSARVLCLDSDWKTVQQQPKWNPEPLGTPDDLAYVLFTSGSTGRPKGVAMPHRVLTNLLAWQLSASDPPGAARTLQFASLSFDVAFQELFSTWSTGGTLVLVDEDVRRDPEALLALIDDERVERLFVPFAALQHLAKAALHRELFPIHLREVITAGEALQATPAIREFFWRTNCALHNQYGPTESHVVTGYALTGDPKRWPARPPIGRPIANARTYVLDENRARIPVGIPGELYIGGPVLARGYLNRPDLTAERFLLDPFDGGKARMYRTGDRGRYLSTGEIEFLGRTDDQVKIRGYRVEPAEVEAVLREHEQLQDAAVVAHEASPDDRQLVAYTVAEQGCSPTSSELREFLATRLPEFMIPATFVALEALPLGPTGKVDRRALPAPVWRDPDADELVAPRDELERRLVEIWQRSLGIGDAISVRDDFFELGGHSLLAVRVIAMIEESIGVKLPLASLFEAATVERMAERVSELAQSQEDWPTLVRLRAGGSRPPLFLLHGDDGELLHYRELVLNFGPDQPVYGIQPIGLDGRGEPSLSVQEMAVHYVDELCAFQPDGPYLLAGYCFSGVLAYEVAHQLSLRGLPPAFVGLIDASPYGVYRRPTRIELERKKFADFRKRDLGGKMLWVSRRLRGLVAKARTKARFALYDAYARSGRKLPSSLRSVEGAIRKATSNYVTPESQIAITLFQAADDGHAALHRSSWWMRLAKNVETRPIVAEGIRHDMIMRDPYARALAAEMEACIERALAGEQSDENRVPVAAGT